MMLSTIALCALLDDLALLKGKAKIDFLRARQDEDLKAFFKAVYDPMITYGVTGKTVKLAMERAPAMVDRAVEVATFIKAMQPLATRQITGNRAVDYLHSLISVYGEPGQRLITAMVDKDVRAGVGLNSVNDAYDDYIPVFAPMLAHKFDPKRIKKWPVIVEAKHDGVRTLALVRIEADWVARLDGLAEGAAVIPDEQMLELGTVQLLSRSGKEFPALELLKPDLIRRAISGNLLTGRLDFVFDGETVSGIFNETVSAVRSKSEKATDAEYHVWDLISIEEFSSGKFRDPLEVRQANLRKLFSEDESGWHTTRASRVKLLQSYTASNAEECIVYYERFRDAGLEGAIVKVPEALYESKRSYGWMKLKPQEPGDFKVIGAERGTGKYANTLGALVIDVDGVAVRCSGMTDPQRDILWQKHLDGELEGIVIEVEYHEKTPDGSLRHPRFKRLREDKKVGV